MNFIKIKLQAQENFIDSQKAVSEKRADKVYHIAKPILLFLASFFIIPKKVRLILGHLIEVLDALYPVFTKETLSNPSGDV
jgi:hypothetical protein